MNEQQRQAYLDQINYGRIERVIAYKNVQFIIEHQHDGLEQLTAYLKSCMEDIGHPPAMVEVIGSEYIEYRFGSWKAAIRSFYAGKTTNIKKPPHFRDRKIVQDLCEIELRRLAAKDAASSEREVQR